MPNRKQVYNPTADPIQELVNKANRNGFGYNAASEWLWKIQILIEASRTRPEGASEIEWLRMWFETADEMYGIDK